MPLNDNDLLLINDSQDSNEAKKIKYSTLKSNITGDIADDLQGVTDNGNTTDNKIDVGGGGTSTQNQAIVAHSNATASDAHATIYARNMNADGNVFVGVDDAGSTNITLKADGSAEFNAGLNHFQPSGNLRMQNKSGADDANAAIFTRNAANDETTFKVGYDGAASFSGTDLKIENGGSLLFDGSAATAYTIRDGGVTKTELNKNGSAKFAGNVTSTTWDETSNSGSGYNLRTSQGQLLLQQPDGTSEASCLVINRGDTPNITLVSDGSAKFASDVDVGGWGATTKGLRLWGSGNAGIQLHVPASSTAGCIVINSGTNGTNYTDTKASINNDGSASFAGWIDTTGRLTADVTSDPRGSSYAMVAKNDHPARGAFRAENFGGGLGLEISNGTDTTVEIGSDGSASFNGNITSGSLNSTSDSATGIEIFGSTGRINVQRPSTQGSDQLWNGYLGKTSTSEIFANGNATFKGITADQRTLGDGSAMRVIGKGTTTLTPALQISNGEINGTILTAFGRSNAEVINFYNNGAATFASGITAPNVTFNLETDDPTNFNAEGEYTGPTLDVKSVIQTLQQKVEERDATIATLTTRLSAIENADITDDAEHSALLTLVANLATRVTALEQGGN